MPNIKEILSKKPVCVVAGAAGFIGSHLCEALLTQNVKVVGIDNLMTGKKENLASLFEKPDFSFYEWNLLNPLPQDFVKPDYVFHLAGVEEYINGVDVSLEILLVNSQGTKNLLDYALRGKAKFLLGSSFGIYQAAVSQTSLRYYAGLSVSDSQKYSHYEAKRFSEALVAEYFQKQDLDCRVCRLADVYGPKMPLVTGSEIGKFLEEVLKEEKITIPGDGLKILHPTFISDVIYGLLKAMFAEEAKGKIFTLVNAQEINLLALTNEIKKLRPKIKIVFGPEKEELKFPIRTPEIGKTMETLGWEAKETLDSGIERTLSWFEKTQKQDINKILGYSDIGILSERNEREIKRIKHLEGEQVNKLDEQRAGSTPLHSGVKQARKELINNEQKYFQSGDEELRNLKAKLPNGKKVLTGVAVVAATMILVIGGLAAKEAADAGAQRTGAVMKQGWQIAQNAGDLGEMVFGEKGGNIENALEVVSLDLGQLETEMAIWEAELKNQKNSTNGLLNWVMDKIPALKGKRLEAKEIRALREKVNLVSKILKTGPSVLGLNTRKTYLVLLQNNMELRPTGGFIGSYGLLTFENGKFVDFKVEDVYSADGQLKGRVNPPDEILHYLGQPNWFLRDSNFSPDFALSAQRAEWFLEKELSRKTDGVIAINLDFAKNLLEAMGPIYLGDYQETINSQNLFERAEYHAEIDFFPGSTQKRDFLSSLANAMTEKLFKSMKTLKPEEQLKVAKALEKSLKEKAILFYFNEPKTQQVFSGANLTGEVFNLPSEAMPLFVSEANLGANKANYFIRRLVDYDLTVEKDYAVTAKIKIDYENQSPNNAWPGGAYKNYLRFYAPAGTTLLRTEYDGKKATVSGVLTEFVLKAVKPEEFLVVKGEETDDKQKYTTFGVLMEVPAMGRKSIEMTLRLPETLGCGEAATTVSKKCEMDFVILKQSGIGTEPMSVTVNYPSFLTPVLSSTIQPEKQEQKLIYRTDTGQDRQIKIRFTR